ncbi:MAG: hypothetical protein BGO01_08925 [Armatimonadetes bacterium 55-13]|nr:MAG: hypothetical protein BGO01_08925 [Armatimonadetes bacterium 55-13]
MDLGLRTMTTSSEKHLSPSLTPQETEAVLELWAKRQSETDALRTRMTIDELAEAISVPPEEIEAMVREVRANPSLPPMNPNEVKIRRRNRWLMGAAVVFWVVFLASAIPIAYEMGRGQTPRISTSSPFFRPRPPEMQVAKAANSPSSMQATMVSSPVLGQAFPQGITASFRGYQVDGQGKNLSEDRIKEGLNNILRRMSSRTGLAGSTSYPEEAILAALQSEDPKSAPLAIAFEEFKVVGKNGSYAVKMPIALQSDPRVVDAVTGEQTRKLEVLANQTKRLSDPQ